MGVCCCCIMQSEDERPSIVKDAFSKANLSSKDSCQSERQTTSEHSMNSSLVGMPRSVATQTRNYNLDNPRQATTSNEKRSKISQFQQHRQKCFLKLEPIQSNLRKLKLEQQKADHQYSQLREQLGVPGDWRPDEQGSPRNRFKMSKITKLYEQRYRIKKRVEQLQDKQYQINEFIQFYSTKINNLDKQPSKIYIGSTILQSNPQDKNYLIKAIQKYTLSKITSIKLANTGLSPTKELSSLDSLLLIAKLKNGSIFGGWAKYSLYAQEAIQTDRVNNSSIKALLFSLTNKQAFPLKKNCFALKKQSGYLIFGVNEIKLKLDSKLVYSNFGIEKGCFQTNNSDSDALLNNETRKVAEIECYQILQVYFSG